MVRVKTCILFATISYVVQATVQQTPLVPKTTTSPFTSDFDTLVKGLLSKWHTPGMAIAVINGNDTWTKGYGYASLDDEIPVTPHTLFYAASTTKSFTASVAALLVENKDEHADIKWDTPLSNLIRDDFVLREPLLTSQITIEDALSHRTGYPRHDETWLFHNVSVQEQVRSLRHLPPSTALRTKFQYNNMMFIAVSHAIERVTGMSLEAVFRQWLWKPLGMSMTSFGLEAAQRCKDQVSDCIRSKNYEWNNRTSSYEEIPFFVIPAASGAGGIVSNVHDYAKWLRSLLFASGPLSASSYAALQTPRAFVSSEMSEPFTAGPEWYGLGLFGLIYRNQKIIQHDGGLGGYTTRMAFLPDRNFGFVIMQNAATPSMNIVAYHLIDSFLGVPPADRYDLDTFFHDEKSKRNHDMQMKPRRLYPDVPVPCLPRTLPDEAYQGSYTHPAYGKLRLRSRTYQESGYKHPLRDADPSDTVLYYEPEYLNMAVILHHVSGEHWLVETSMGIKMKDIPDSYSQARFEIGSGGKVQSLKIIFEESISGEAAWEVLTRSG